eukprot:m.7726 g.7726  ORF g.7726 m.7726 type:complete len:467 (+) comp19483_c0_seq1:151-1551(+)
MGRTKDEMKSELKEAKDAIRSLEKEVSRLKRKLEASESARKRAEDYVDSLREEIKSLHGRIDGRRRRETEKRERSRRRHPSESSSESSGGGKRKKSPLPVDLNEDLLQQNTAEALKLAAEEALQEGGVTYDHVSGWYYDRKTGYYYDQSTKLYYDARDGTYYYYNKKKKSYKFHSKISTDTLMPCVRAIVLESGCLNVGRLAVFTVKGGTIGRDKGLGHCFLLPELAVSKTHAKVTLDDTTSEFLIEDLGSQNGTYVNGSRLTESKVEGGSVHLTHGDSLRIGSTTFVVHVHIGDETCLECEPGQYQTSDASEKSHGVDKSQQRKTELNQLKKRFGLRLRDTIGEKLSTEGNYTDRASKRRAEVGSEAPGSPVVDTASVFVPINSANKGHQMLEKMGWKEGSGLGVEEMGMAEPVMAVMRGDRSGLGGGVRHPLDRPPSRKNTNWTKARSRFAKIATIMPDFDEDT